LKKFWVFIGVLIILSPLGLLLPEYFKVSGAWGEWRTDKIEKLVGYIPKGLENLSSLWNPPFPNYVFKGWEEKPIASLGFAYILSAVAGVLICAGVVFILGKFLSGKK